MNTVNSFYRSSELPLSYACDDCGRHGTKLWKTSADDLMVCAECATKIQVSDIEKGWMPFEKIDGDGYVLKFEFEAHSGRHFNFEGQTTCKLMSTRGQLIPAILGEDGDCLIPKGFIPDYKALAWWESLPTYSYP
jgi:hypothetical protein